MTRERLLRIAETVRDVGTVVFVLVGLLLAQLYAIPSSCVEVGEEEGFVDAPRADHVTTPEGPSFLQRRIEQTKERLKALQGQLRRGELDVRAFRQAQYSALVDLAKTARKTPVEDLGSEVEAAVAFFGASVLEADRVTEGHDPYVHEPTTLGLAWESLQALHPKVAARLRDEFFPDLTLAYLQDMQLIWDTGYFAIPTVVAQDLGYPDYTSFWADAVADETLRIQGGAAILYFQTLVRQEYPAVDARLVLWGLADETLTAEAEEILLRLRIARRVF